MPDEIEVVQNLTWKALASKLELKLVAQLRQTGGQSCDSSSLKEY